MTQSRRPSSGAATARNLQRYRQAISLGGPGAADRRQRADWEFANAELTGRAGFKYVGSGRVIQYSHPWLGSVVISHPSPQHYQIHTMGSHQEFPDLPTAVAQLRRQGLDSLAAKR